MKPSILSLTALAVLVCLGGIPLLAQRGGGGRGGAGGMGGGSMGGGAGMGRGAEMGRGSMDTGRGMDTESHGRMSGMDRGQHSTSMSGRTPSELLAQNTKLSSKLESLLPAGTNVQDAAAGFKNLGQFVAAAHVSSNLGIPFDQLKAKMTGTDAVSLGKAIHELKPDVNAKAEAKKAERHAREVIKESEPGS